MGMEEGSMLAVKSKCSIAPINIATGQVWHMNGINCHIGEVGKRLVHYKLFKGKPARMPSTLGNKEALVERLRRQGAVLVKG
mgnify:CR=1 FL=1